MPLRKIRMRPVLWDWSLYIPAYKPVAIVGPPDTGKSLLVCDFATTMAGGFDWPDGSSAGEPGNVLIMTTEDTAADVLKPRLMAAGAAKIMDRIDVLRMKDKLFSLKTDLPWLEAQLERVAGAILSIAGKLQTGQASEPGVRLSVHVPQVPWVGRYEL